MGHNDVIYVVAAGSLIAAVFLIMCLSDLYSEMLEPGSGLQRERRVASESRQDLQQKKPSMKAWPHRKTESVKVM
jgi:hypothetical protein